MQIDTINYYEIYEKESTLEQVLNKTVEVYENTEELKKISEIELKKYLEKYAVATVNILF